MARLAEQMKKMNKKNSGFTLQLTSMVDMFTILLVFLLKSYSTSAVNPPMGDGIRLPDSTTATAPIEALKLVVSQTGVFVNDEKILEISNERFLAADLSSQDGDLLLKLHERMESEAKKAEQISLVNPTLDFKGEVLMQADKNLPYEILRKVMYTASLSGYGELKLATLAVD